jgi:hypothetical protein
MLWGYATVQFRGSSAVFGASEQSALHMFSAAVVWNLLGPLAWFWAVPYSRWREWNPWRSPKAAFLSLAILPPFLFSAFIHIGDPDQALASVSILTVCGGASLAAFLDRIRSRRVFSLAAAIMAAHALTFFVPPTKLAKASSYKAVAAVDRMTANAITTIEELRREGPVTIVHYGSSVAYRHLQYYFPEDYVTVLPDSPRELIQLYFRHGPIPSSPETGFLHPRGHRILCLAGRNVDPRTFVGWQSRNGIYYIDSLPALPFRVGPYQLLPAE